MAGEIRNAPDTGRVGRELRGIRERAERRQARAVAVAAKRIRALERRIAARH
jgi:hypothetical protein